MSDEAARAAKILPAKARFTRDPGGAFYVRSVYELGGYPARITDRLHHWAATVPTRTFLAWRGTDGAWDTLTYGDTLQRVRAIAQSLIDRRLSPAKPLLILSGNSAEHALLALAAMYCGVPYAPVAPAYSLLAREFTTLRLLWATMNPGLVFAADGALFERALASMPKGVEVVTCTPAESLATTPFADLAVGAVTNAVDQAHANVGPATIAKILFTSGSTGSPKGVINTQEMLCANQEMIRTVMAFLGDEPPVLCDWLPWNHTFGGNHNFGLVLYNGGTLYIDEGRPVPGEFDATLRNLKDVAQTASFNVPKGYEMLVPHLRSDVEFRRRFFSRLQMLFYAAAGLRQQTADELDALAIETRGEAIPWVTGLGATETAPFALCTGVQMRTTATVGLPVPGVELKAAPVGDQLEARLRGPSVTPGYWRNAELTRMAFDEEGFYKLGDAIAFADPNDPTQGFVLRGRLDEDFKLSSGTWVRVGPLRARFLGHFGSLVHDVVLAGPNRNFVVALIFPNVDACRLLASPTQSTSSTRDILEDERVRQEFGRLLSDFADEHVGSSTSVRRARLMVDPPSIDIQEITDKGSVNQKAVLANRATLVDELYEGRPPALVIHRTQEHPLS